MTNTVTGQPLKVEMSTIAPYLRLPYTQAHDVMKRLEAAGIWHEMSEVVISVNGGPEMATLNFSRKTRAEQVQTVLDQASFD